MFSLKTICFLLKLKENCLKHFLGAYLHYISYIFCIYQTTHTKTLGFILYRVDQKERNTYDQ